MYYKRWKLCIYTLQITVFSLLSSALTGQITGIVFKDYNHNGIRDSSIIYEEALVSNAILKLFGSQGFIAQTQTNSNGKYIFNTNSNPPFRIELVLDNPEDYETSINSDSGGSQTAVRFETNNNSIINFGIQYPKDYSKDPFLITPCYVFGDPLPANSLYKDSESLVKWNLSSGGTTANDAKLINNGGTSPNVEVISTASEIGSCWGLTIQKNTQTLFTSGTLRRHSGLGPAGLGGIYHIDISSHSVLHTINVSQLGIPIGTSRSNNERGIIVNFPPNSKDSLSFSEIGKVGIGAIDLSEDERTLYITNLFTRKIYSIPVQIPFVMPTASQVDSFAIPDPGCTGGNYRPWALKSYRGKLYVGVICDGSISKNTGNLSAFIYELNPITKSFTQILEFPLNYSGFNSTSRFLPWLDEWDIFCQESNNIYCTYTQPILMSIDFESENEMFIGIADRYGLQTGYHQPNTSGNGSYSTVGYGDVLKARRLNNNSVFTLESNGNDGVQTTAGKNTGIGPANGEYFFGDHSILKDGNLNEAESALGPLINCPGNKSIIITSQDPFDVRSNGIIHLDKKSGNWSKRLEIIGPTFNNFSGKALGLGDLRIQSAAPPIQIGNYIWKDLNGNGIQDPIEQGLEGVVVNLLKNGNTIATATTNEKGQYVFSSEKYSGTNSMPESFIYEIEELTTESTYSLQINTLQSALSQFNISPFKNNFPVNTLIDNDGNLLAANTVGTIFSTKLSGQNDFSFDFGFIPTSSCEIKFNKAIASECNALTNSFNLELNIDLINVPIGNVTVKLSSGQSWTTYVVKDGNYDFVIKNIETKGQSDIDIQVTLSNNPLCELFIADAFDQPIPCCDLQHQICTNRSTQVRLLAAPGMAQYRWYKKSDQSIIGFTDILTINNQFSGLEDKYEEYYFEAIDSTGDTIRQFCSYKINLIECCTLQVNTFLQTDCNNNGTRNFINDDWFSILVGTENTSPGNSSAFEILKDNIILGSAPYGTPLLVGSPTIPDFKADGISIYKIVIRDIDNHSCQDSVFTQISFCPTPKVVVSKTFISTNILSDASHNAVYRIDVENIGDETGAYSLMDDQGFDDDISIKTAYYTTTVPFKTGAALFGTGPWNLLNNVSIPAGAKHSYNVVINFNINLNANSSGDNQYTACNISPSRGQALFNRALLDGDNDGFFESIDTACADIPVLDVVKELLEVVTLDQSHSLLKYRIKVTNSGGASSKYNLLEDPQFDDDISILSASLIINHEQPVSLLIPEPNNGWIISNQRTIANGSTDSFHVNFLVNLDLREGSIGDNMYRLCISNIPLQQRQEKGLHNITGLDLNNDFRPEIRDTTCGDLPSLSHNKFLLEQIRTGAHTNTLIYLFTIQNKGGKEGIYNLQDQLAFDDDVIINNAYYKINSGPSIILNNITGSSFIKILDQKSIFPGTTDSIFLTLDLELDLDNAGGGNNLYVGCIKNSSQQFIPYHGLFNESGLDVNNDNIVDEYDTVCTNFQYFDLALRKICLNTNPVKYDENVFFRNTIINQGTAIAYNINIVDYIPRAYSFSNNLNPGWNYINDSTYAYTIASLAPGDSINIDLVLILNYFSQLQKVINTAEISSLVDSDGLPAIDIDSEADMIINNDNNVYPNSEFDNKIDGRRLLNAGDDEDDHDVAQAPIFDIALVKTLSTPPPYNHNDTLDFKITLYNQGNVVIYSSSIVDYIPAGYLFIPNLNPFWNLVNNTAITFIRDSIKIGDSLSSNIKLKLLSNTTPQDWVNISEVLNASINRRLGVHASINDVDSDFDINPLNDKGGKINDITNDNISEDGLDRNKNGILDEDDHDPAVPFLWDLALKKILITSTPHFPGKQLDYLIRIYNQGTDTLGEITVRDYIPDGLLIIPSENPNWNINSSSATITIQKNISPGDSLDIHIYLYLKEGLKNFKSYINYSEIISSKNKHGEDRTGFDLDSREASNSVEENSVLPNSIYDNNISVSIKDMEEDDHDPASPSILDLALMKSHNLNRYVNYSDTLTFEIEIINQGYCRVDKVEIVDYIPIGLQWINNPGWVFSPNTRSASLKINSILVPGQRIKLPIKFIISDLFSISQDLVNRAEITSATDSLGAIYNRDIDAKFDFDRFNDEGGIPNSLSDNFIDDDGFDTDGDGIKDEDDEDPAFVALVDFALKKEINTSKRTSIGDTAEFTIHVYNQGSVVATEFSIVDYLSPGYKFLPNINPGWNPIAGNISSNKKIRILPGDYISFLLKLEILNTLNPNDHCNYSEITSAKDELGNEIAHHDADSKPSSNTQEERNVKPGSIWDNNIKGKGQKFNDDEDDHDVAGIGGPSKLGDMVWYDINANGIMETGEPGIRNVQVQLFDFNSKAFLNSTLTNTSGKYVFDNLNSGKYFIKVIPPITYSFSPADIGLDTLDSDITNTFGKGTSGMITLPPSTNDKSWDIGLYNCSGIEGFIFFDTNQNGILDPKENGINGISVSLYSYPGKILQARTLTKTITTSFIHDGFYKFCVKPGSYYIKVEELQDFSASPYLQGSDTRYDSDLNNKNGRFTSPAYYMLAGNKLEFINGGIYNPNFTLTRANTLEPMQNINSIDSFFSIHYYNSNIEQENSYILNEDFIIYPNPAHDKLTVAWTTQSLFENTLVELKSMDGKIIFSEKVKYSNKTSIQCSHIPDGIYQVSVNNNSLSKNKLVSICK
ncbi:MAG: T9SS type A sorting domain-containing protein [Saprospiraceae bacterium]|nr:T9SS type A sorting domain-containing protein [Saprospiraceae bacterium]